MGRVLVLGLVLRYILGADFGISRVMNLSVKAMNTFELYSVNESLVDLTIL
jgi:hypothetical protein